MLIRFLFIIFFALFFSQVNAETFSVYGNSISTYPGYIPSDYNCWYTEDQMMVEDTWWYQVGVSMNWTLCNNSSWSGSRVSYDKGSIYDSYFISPYRIENLSKNGIPNHILICGGVNDWIWSKNDLGNIENEDSTTFCGAYRMMLDRLKNKYPFSKLYVISILPTTYNNQNIYSLNSKGWNIDQANDCIKNICSIKNVAYIDMKYCKFAEDVFMYTFDGLHPNIIGMKHIADYISNTIKEISYISSINTKQGKSNYKGGSSFKLNGEKAIGTRKRIVIRQNSDGSFSKIYVKN